MERDSVWVWYVCWSVAWLDALVCSMGCGEECALDIQSSSLNKLKFDDLFMVRGT